MLILTLLLACPDPSKDKPVATVTRPAPVTEPAPPAPGGDQLVATGTIGFTGAKVTKSHDGTFGAWTGRVEVKGDQLVGVEFSVDLTTVDVGIGKLNTHLKSPDFFDVAQFPTATFVSRSLTPGAPLDSKLAGATHTVSGDLTLRGKTNTLTFPAMVTVTPEAVAGRTEFVVNRQDFGVAYPGKPDDLIRDEVVVRVDWHAARNAAAPVPR